MFSPWASGCGKASPRTAHPELLCPNAMEFAICWTDPSFCGGEIKDLLHNEPWDCPLPGNGAALVSSSSFSSICWVWMLKLGACEFCCTCLELIHHRLGFGFSLPDQLSSFTPRFPFSHTLSATLKQFLWCSSNPLCSVQLFSLPVLPVQYLHWGCWLWCGAVEEGVRLGKLCALSVSGMQMGRLLPPPCQV